MSQMNLSIMTKEFKKKNFSERIKLINLGFRMIIKTSKENTNIVPKTKFSTERIKLDHIMIS